MKRSFVLLMLALLLAMDHAWSEEACQLPSFPEFVWQMVPEAGMQSNASYTVYTWEVPAEVGEEPVREYLAMMCEAYGLKKLSASEDGADWMIACAMPACAELGFRVRIGTETVKGCHVLAVWRSSPLREAVGTLALYLNRGIGLTAASNRSAVLPSPTPTSTPTPTPDPTVTPAPTPTPSPDPTSKKPLPVPDPIQKTKCDRCGGSGKRDCRTCDGKGYLEVWVDTPEYSGIGTGFTGMVQIDCSNLFCQGGKVDCEYCNDGWR